MVVALDGDSTITKFFAISCLYLFFSSFRFFLIRSGAFGLSICPRLPKIAAKLSKKTDWLTLRLFDFGFFARLPALF